MIVNSNKLLAKVHRQNAFSKLFFNPQLFSGYLIIMFTHKKKSYYGKGFTLLELMVTVVIAGILASMAVPSFTQAIKNNRMSTQINELLATFNYARSEAIKRSSNVIVCKSNNTTATPPSCGGNWQDGWVVFVNIDANTTIDTGDTVLRVHKPSAGDTDIDFSGVVNYASSGLDSGGARTLTLCDSRSDGDKRGIVFSATGHGRAVEHDESTLSNC